MYLKSTILVFIIFITSTTYAQLGGVNREEVIDEDNVFLDGIISDYYSGDVISGVKVTATSGGKTITGTSDGKGEYKMVLEYDKEYTISYSKGGFISKSITINTSGVPDLKRQRVPDVSAEITLFKPNECIKSEMLDKPIGRAIYFADKNVIDWDMTYSMSKLAALNEMLDDCADEIEKQKELEEQKEKEYADVMKEANKAFAKQDWETATSNYKKALELFDDRPQPKERLKLIETELAKKAEAEKQRAEEKARAEAEALAKAEKEAAAKKAEEERLAKEKAEKEALARAEAEKEELAKAEAAAKKAEEERLAKEKAEQEAIAKAEAEAKAKEAAKKAEAEKLAKEKAEKEALAKTEREAKEKAETEAEAKKIAEAQAKKQEKEALLKAKEEEKAKILAEKEAKKRADQEAMALKEKEIAQKQEEKERLAKEQAAALAQKAEEERAENQVIIAQENEEIKIETAKQIEEEKKTPAYPQGKPSIKIKGSNKGRHLYVKPNKHRNGRGPNFKQKIVF